MLVYMLRLPNELHEKNNFFIYFSVTVYEDIDDKKKK